jgi:hypothetical protein
MFTQGLAPGLAQGLAPGLALGLAQGLALGLAQGLALGLGQPPPYDEIRYLSIPLIIYEGTRT